MRKQLLIMSVMANLATGSHQPEWAKSAIWYQIFPDRFRNGDSTNDPTIKTLEGTWPYEKQISWEVTPWTSDWYEPQPWEIENGEDFYYNAQLRRYGGDIQGIIDKLDYLQDLGVNAIYLNPIFESPSTHKYGAKYYHHVDNNFGPDPRGDEKIWAEENPADPVTWQWTSADSLFLQLIDDVHGRNMKIIIDGVFNHVGIPFWAFQDVVENGEGSTYSNWFTVTSWDNPETAEDEFDYGGWSGIKDLPVLTEDENGLLPPIRHHIHAVVKRWMDPNGDGNPSDGIDGWRLDVADQVHLNFWKEFRQWVVEINPNAYLVGEVWWDDFWNNTMLNAAPWLEGDAFHGVMNYRLADALFKFMIDEKNKISATEFNNLLNEMINDYSYENFLYIQNILGSHDTERVASSCVNPDRWIDHANNLQYNPEFKVCKPNQEERQLQKLLIAFQFLFPGTPYIYYGDEAGMWGADDPDCRKPMIWNDLTYEAETHHSRGLSRPVDEVSVNDDLMQMYQKMINIRTSYPSLQTGDYTVNLMDDESGMFVFTRSISGKGITAVFNRSSSTQNLKRKELNFLNDCSLIDKSTDMSNNEVKAKSYMIWRCYG